MTDPILNFYQTYLAQFEEKYFSATSGFDHESIHKMRVSVKRLRTFYQFAKELPAESFRAKKTFKPIRKIFKLAAPIRDVQIQQEILGSYEEELNQKFPDYKRVLHDMERSAIGYFKELHKPASSLDELISTGQTKEVILKAGNGKLSEVMDEMLAKKLQKIERLKIDARNYEKLHRIRTILKQVYYLLEMAGDHVDPIEVTGMTMIRLKEIQDLFGDWHDRLISEEYIDKYLENHSREEIAPLLVKLRNDRKEMYLSIVEVLDKEMIFNFPAIVLRSTGL